MGLHKLVSAIAFLLFLTTTASAAMTTFSLNGTQLMSGTGAYATSTHCSGTCGWLAGTQVIVGAYDTNPANWGGTVEWDFDISSIPLSSIDSATVTVSWPSLAGKGLHSTVSTGTGSIKVKDTTIATIQTNYTHSGDWYAHDIYATHSFTYNIDKSLLDATAKIYVSTSSLTAWDVSTVALTIYTHDGDIQIINGKIKILGNDFLIKGIDYAPWIKTTGPDATQSQLPFPNENDDITAKVTNNGVRWVKDYNNDGKIQAWELIQYDIELMKGAGINTIRTYATGGWHDKNLNGQLDTSTNLNTNEILQGDLPDWAIDRILQYAQANNMKVILGYWVQEEDFKTGMVCDANDLLVAEQAFGRIVTKYKDNPAVLAWGIGNEVAGTWNHQWFTWGMNVNDYLNQLNTYVRTIDNKHHPIIYSKYVGENANFNNLNADIIAENTYTHSVSDLTSLGEFNIAPAGGRTYMLGEFGHNEADAQGQWTLAQQYAGGAFLEFNNVWWKGDGQNLLGIVDEYRHINQTRYGLVQGLYNGQGYTETPVTTITPACTTNSQCGTDGFTGTPACQTGNVYQNMITFTCNNPGLQTAYCSNTTTQQIKQNCGSTSSELSIKFCNGNQIIQTNTTHNRGCVVDSCTSYDTQANLTVQTCSAGQICSGGYCTTTVQNKSMIFYETFDSIQSILNNNGNLSQAINSQIDPGMIGNALHVGVNHTGSSVTYPLPGVTLLNEGTIEFLFKSLTSYHGLLELDSNLSPPYWSVQDYFMYFINQDGSWVELYHGGQDANGKNVSDQNWHLATMTWKCGTANNSFFSIHVDGDPGFWWWDQTICPYASFPAPLTITVGSSYWYGAGEALFDELKVFNYARNDTQILSDYASYFGNNIACSNDAQCGTNGWTGPQVCQSGDLMQNTMSFACYNPGLVSSYCRNWTYYEMRQDCGNTTSVLGSKMCDGNNIVQTNTTHNKGCSENACTLFDTKYNQTIQTCQYGCTNAACNLPPPACSQNTDCGTNSLTNVPFCSATGNVQQNYTTFTCKNPGLQTAYCTNTTTLNTLQTCGVTTYDSWSANTCSTNGNVIQNRIVHNNGCSGNACTSLNTTETKSIQNCTIGCNNGACIIPKCTTNAQCGTDGWTGALVCSNADIMQPYKTFTCNNPGLASSYCTNTTTTKLKQDCGNTTIDPWSTNYCSGKNVMQKRTVHNKGCSGTTCTSSDVVQTQTITTCVNSCVNGACYFPSTDPKMIFLEKFDNLNMAGWNIFGSPQQTTGRLNGAVYFPTGSYATNSLNIPLNSSAGTIQFWVNLATMPATGTPGIGLLELGKLGYPNSLGLMIIPYSGAQVMIQESRDSTGYLRQSWTPKIAITKNTWHLVSLTWNCNNANSYTQVYLDGIAGSKEIGACSSISLSGPIRIAKPSMYYNQLPSSIDDLRVYNYVKTAAQIRNDYVNPQATV